jgi:septal ring factor EnvC (AmiA/AmiB activator)
MANKQNAIDRIQELKAEIASLEQSAIAELKERRNALAQELAGVDAEIAHLTGRLPEGRKTRARGPKTIARSLPLQDLKELLAAAPGKTLSVRKEGLDLANIKTLAAANPHLLRLGGKGPWPTVTLLK